MPLGFSKNNKPKRNIRKEGISLEDKYNLDEDVEEEVDEDRSRKKSTPPSKRGRRPSRMNEDRDSKEGQRAIPKNIDRNNSPFKVLFFVSLVLAILAFVGLGYTFMLLNETKSNLLITQDDCKKKIDAMQRQLASEQDKKKSAGIPDLYRNSNKKSDSVPEKAETLITDIKGDKITPDFEIKKVDRVKDYVNYVKHRTIMDKGMEFYWLECDFKGSRYIIATPLCIYKELDDHGITAVNMELITTKDNKQVITNMSVMPNAKQALEKGDKR